MNEYLKTAVVVLFTFLLGSIAMGVLICLVAYLLMHNPILVGAIIGIAFVFWFVHVKTVNILYDKKHKDDWKKH